jgi:hypothetical protein
MHSKSFTGWSGTSTDEFDGNSGCTRGLVAFADPLGSVSSLLAGGLLSKRGAEKLAQSLAGAGVSVVSPKSFAEPIISGLDQAAQAAQRAETLRR